MKIGTRSDVERRAKEVPTQNGLFSVPVYPVLLANRLRLPYEWHKAGG
jgi:hypothetical protein